MSPLPPLLLRGDCLVELARIPDNSVDSIVTDPPYGLGFMGKGWDIHTPLDFERFTEAWAAECLRILKPGGHLLAFGGSRTWHRLAAGIEDAGFEIRDSIAWLYGSGFPKSMDVSKAIDKAAGFEGEVIGQRKSGIAASHTTFADDNWKGIGQKTYDVRELSPEAREWEGWGTALKPAFEPIVVARKPLGEKTVAANVLAHGTGALNIDASRIGTDTITSSGSTGMDARRHAHGTRPTNYGGGTAEPSDHIGRWPANVVLDESQAAALDEQSGTTKSVRGVQPANGRSSGIMGKVAPRADAGAPMGYADLGGASRFFYVAKAPKSERPVYWKPSCNCETIKPCAEPSPQKAIDESRSAVEASSSMSSSGKKRKGGKSRPVTTSITSTETSSTTNEATSSSSRSSSTSESIRDASFVTANGGSPAESAASSSPSQSSTGTSPPKAGPYTVAADPATLSEWSEISVCGNCGAPAKSRSHETVKPLALMRWLIRLVTPPGGCVVDPFAGSGTTLEAAYLEGFESIGVELTADYWPLIEARIARVTA